MTSARELPRDDDDTRATDAPPDAATDAPETPTRELPRDNHNEDAADTTDARDSSATSVRGDDKTPASDARGDDSADDSKTRADDFNVLLFLRDFLKRNDEVLATIIVATIVVASFWRLKFGVDFTDEAFYAAITQRFALGDKPYFDEFNLRQTASLIPVPFYWAYLKIAGGTNGVVYFLRCLYFALQLGVCWSIFAFLRLRVSRSLALIACILPVVFIPFGIPTCSYNNQCAMFFTAGTFVCLRALFLLTKSEGSSESEPQSPAPNPLRLLIGGGILHGLACMSYPPIALPVIAFAVLFPIARWLETKPPRPAGAKPLTFGELRNEIKPLWPLWSRYVAGLIIMGAVLFLCIVYGVAHGGVSAATGYEQMTTHARSADKAKEVINNMLALIPGGPGWFAALGVVGLIAKLIPRLRKFVLGALAIYVAYYFQDTQPGYPGNANSIYASIYLGLLAGFFLLFVNWKKEGRTLILAGWIPAVIAGFVTGFATANGGCINGGIGLFSGAALSLVALAMVFEQRTPENDESTDSTDTDTDTSTRRLPAVLTIGAVAAFSMLSMNMKVTYRAGAIESHTARVRTGPYRGIWSAPLQVQQAEDMTREIRQAMGENPQARMLSYYDFPAPYLTVTARPAIQTVWTDSRAQLDRLIPYYAEHRTPGQGIIFVVSGMGHFSPELEQRTIHSDHLIKDAGWFKLYREVE